MKSSIIVNTKVDYTEVTDVKAGDVVIAKHADSNVVFYCRAMIQSDQWEVTAMNDSEVFEYPSDIDGAEIMYKTYSSFEELWNKNRHHMKFYKIYF